MYKPAPIYKNNTAFTDRLIQWCHVQGYPYVFENDILWYDNGSVVQPLMPYHKSIQISDGEAKQILEKIGGGVIRWGERKKMGSGHSSEWYVAFKSFGVFPEDFDDKFISKINAGIKYCEIAPISAEQVARDGHLFLIKNKYLYYQDPAFYLEREDEKMMRVKKDASFEGLCKYYGVFFENRLIGYCRCMEFDKVEMQMTHYVIDPDYSKFKPLEALLYTVFTWYFEDKGFKNIIAGTRPIGPVSDEFQYLIDSFKFDKLPMSLKVVFREDIQYKVSWMRPFSRLISKVSPEMKKYLSLDRERTLGR
jgi:hypothetical protein